MDEMFGPVFITVFGYFAYPVKIWINGHEYAKRTARAEGIGFTELDNGFTTTEGSTGLQPRRAEGIGGQLRRLTAAIDEHGYP